MDTAEKRADKYLLSQGLIRGACASQIDYGARCMYDGYIQGDADRKAIEDDHLREVTQKVIDKAIQYWDARLRELKQEIREGYDISRPRELIDFKKAMEE